MLIEKETVIMPPSPSIAYNFSHDRSDKSDKQTTHKMGQKK